MEFKIARNLQLFALPICLFLLLGGIVAKSQDKSQTPAATPKASPQLTEQQIRGEGIFLQRCSLCHLRKAVRPYRSFGPNLNGMFREADPDQIEFFRKFISTGMPDKMPGFQYALSPDDFNDLISYLKTL